MSVRYPVKDQVAIVGVGTTEFSRDSGKSSAGLAIEASVNAIRDAGFGPSDIDGIFGTEVNTARVQAALGLPSTTWFGNHARPFSFQLLNAVNAVFAGACETALIYHSVYRPPGRSRSAGNDALRVRATEGRSGPPVAGGVHSVFGPLGYAAWASRYLAEYGARREYFGLAAINSRSNAGRNDHAVLRDPMTMDDYLSARMVREPLGMLDMDLPIDGGDALVITTAERARDLPHPAVLVHVGTVGQTAHAQEEQTTSLRDNGQTVVAKALWERSDLRQADIDVLYPYDGFTVITLAWLESLGFCGFGEAGAFLGQHWDHGGNRVLINGRVPMNTHGGSLSEGGTQGSGHLREAVVQLRGQAGSRQVPGARSALVSPGGFFFNAAGFILRTA